MSKYDCSKTLDFVHEFTRMCDGGCRACPLLYRKECTLRKVTEKTIAIVQKWSDEHPEKPKLTKKEKAFLDSFAYLEGKSVQNCGGIVYLMLDGVHPKTVTLAEGMFRFAKTRMSLDELAELEVEDE